MCVSEEGGREGGGGRGADTELKTKTPHVNVGNKTEFTQREAYWQSKPAHRVHLSTVAGTNTRL